MSRISELEDRLDALTIEILIPMRMSKTVDAETVNRLYALVSEMAAELGDAELVPRLLVGKLWFIFTQMLVEAEHTRSPDDILMVASSYASRLRQIFGPALSSSPTTPPGVPRF